MIFFFDAKKRRYDCISTCAGEIHAPAKTIPTALFVAVALVAISYCVPLAVAVACDKTHWEDWGDGSFTRVGYEASTSVSY